MRDRRLFKWLDRGVGIPLVAGLGFFSRRGARWRPAPRPLGPGGRVLVIKFSALGDTLLLLPILKALRQQVGPQGRVDMVATPVNAGVLQGLAWVDTVHVLKPGQLLTRPWRGLSLIRDLRTGAYDWALDMDQWLRASALLAFASGAAARAGFRTPGQHKDALFTASAPNHRQSHEFEQFKAVAALAGLDPASVEPYAGFLLKAGFLGAAPAPRGRPPLVLLHPGTGGAHGWQREWPVERFAALGRRLRARPGGARLGLSGAGPYERGLCDAINAALDTPAEEACVDTGLRSLVGALCRADLLVCGNTGVMHLAAGLGTPLLALHGPNPALKWGPLADAPGSAGRTKVLEAQLPCSPCLTLGFEFGCPARPCMESIMVEDAAADALDLLAAGV